MLTCVVCFKPIDKAADGRVIFRADKAWADSGTDPDVVHEDCLDERLRKRYRREYLQLTRIAPLEEMLRPLIEALGMRLSADDCF